MDKMAPNVKDKNYLRSHSWPFSVGFSLIFFSQMVLVYLKFCADSE